MTTSFQATDAPLVSILCITYNHADYVAIALDAFLAQQTSFKVEIVVGDDCSSDGTLAVLDRYAQQQVGRIRVLPSSVNLGVTRNFRRTLQACRGRYIAICEGDDFWRGTRKLQDQVEFLEAHPDFVMSYHDATIVDKSGEPGGSQLPVHLKCDASKDELIAARQISTLTVCFRNVLTELPPELDQAPALDLCLWSLLGHYGKGKYLAGIEPAGYRVHAAGVFSMQSERNRHLMTAQTLLCLSRIYARRGEHAASDAALLKALRTASVPLGPLASLRLLCMAAARVLISLVRVVSRVIARPM